MPSPPLPDSISDQLRDPTTALAAAFVIANHHPEILQWVAHMEAPRAARKSNGGARKPHNGDAHLSRRRSKRDRDDKALLAAMRTNPEGTINDWAAAIGKSRSSAVTALHRLKDAGMAESDAGKWRLVEAPAPREPPPKWTAPLRGNDRAAHAHLTAAS